VSTNKYKPHVLVLPEDDADRQIANGFILNPDFNERAIQILLPAGGWRRVVEEFQNVHAQLMQQYPERRIVLMIDFDNQAERISSVKGEIPKELSDRVFILGVLSEPEDLKANLRKSFEAIGESLAQDCSDNTRRVWRHDLLKHNEPELDRMVSLVKPFLFMGTDQRYS
jgi:hypothetical protein